MLTTLFFATMAAAAPPSTTRHAEFPPQVEMVQANCNAAAQRVVEQTGGQLLSVSPGPNGSCSVTVLVPGQGDERPRKRTVTVPAG